MMEEKFSEELVEEFQASLYRPLTDEEIKFLYWIGEQNTTKAMMNATENSVARTESFV
ncbi:hypothetical protein HUG20_15935 [Salicibibacter cibi]|uniref:Uncharacterized protein n=1 Tax=Salicibibacter cibi TaxID=2743001 RepID=A0A7T6ZD84_9BACI|nr:hypothetical protein [Salicibibacter cibi]QQK81247.1 hypothetical protein HUG20_15935 [Salicibibacter cibi]